MLTPEKSFELNLAKMSQDRRDLLDRFTGGKPTPESVGMLSRFLTALRDTVASRRRTKLRGLGVFEWHPASGRLPTGGRYKSWRLVFTINRKTRKEMTWNS